MSLDKTLYLILQFGITSRQTVTYVGKILIALFGGLHFVESRQHEEKVDIPDEIRGRVSALNASPKATHCIPKTGTRRGLIIDKTTRV